jgi:hypothetical protein
MTHETLIILTSRNLHASKTDRTYNEEGGYGRQTQLLAMRVGGGRHGGIRRTQSLLNKHFQDE